MTAIIHMQVCLLPAGTMYSCYHQFMCNQSCYGWKSSTCHLLFSLITVAVIAESVNYWSDACHIRLLLWDEQMVDVMQVRKAYKKCSLRFHPDKAVTHCKFTYSLGLQGAALADRLEIETRVRDEANWLFKCISEANVVLSDPQKRHILDSELEFEERRMFYRNDLSTPPGGSYSFSRPAASANNRASANPRPAANPQPSAHAR